MVRVVEGVSGRVDMRMQLAIRFGYGSVLPWVRRAGSLITAVAGPDALSLWTPVDTHGEDMTTVAEFTVKEGEQVPFVLTWFPSHEEAPRPVDARFAIEDTELWWEDWSSTLHFRRSLARRRDAFAHHLEGPHLQPDRRHRRRPHHLAARDARGGPQLGLPVLLAARRHLDAGVAHAGRLLRGGHGLAQLAAAGRGRRPGRSPDHVRAGRRAASRRVGGATGSRATKRRPPSGSATPPPASSSSTSTAR